MDLSPFDSLFSKNVPHILEKIFFSLDYESFKNCLQVSKDWKEQLASELFQRKGKSVFNEELFLDEGKLIKASRDGIQDEVKRLLSSVMLDVNCKYGPRSCKDGPRGPGSTSLRWPGSTPLHQAAFYGRNFVVQILLNMGADLSKADIFGSTPLHWAAGGLRVTHKKVVRVLLDAGADPNKTNSCGRTPLHMVKNKDMAKLLLDGGADPNITKKDGQTPLHYAAQFCSKDVIGLLLERGVELNVEDRYGNTPLNKAAQFGNTNVIKLLLERGANPNKANRFGKTPLHYGAASGHNEMVKLLLDKGADRNKVDNSGQTPRDLSSKNRLV